MIETRILKFLCLTLLIIETSSDNCKISWVEAGHEVAESQYIIDLAVANTTGHLRTYFPNTNYDIIIKPKVKSRSFTQFYFSIANVNKSMSYGTLELREKELSRFHNAEYCINKIIDGPVSLSKLNLTIGWQSPGTNSGCVLLTAKIKETEMRYHSANLTVCEDARVAFDNPGEVLRNCCACDAGKYELVFEGYWSRYTHPKSFPKREWLAVFPTIIGTSHNPQYKFWQPYAMASDGLQNFAQTGNTIGLESELKMNRNSISTLIKFRGTNFQNKTNKAYASLRVDSQKHVVSLVARMEPSPDWFIGVSSLELCTTDCTWIENKELNLYAYDAGVRDGILYEDLEGPTEPQDIINSLNMTWPPAQNDIESPFYDITNNTHDVRPLAKITLRRLRGSENSCRASPTHDYDCANEWSDWGDCSVKCGTGLKMRNRTIKEEYTSNSMPNCTLPLEEKVSCDLGKCEEDVTEEDCVLNDWEQWTPCEESCGLETTRRERTYKWSAKTYNCTKKFKDNFLLEVKDCGHPPCPMEEKYTCKDKLYSDWSDWSECSVTEGRGIMYKKRVLVDVKIQQWLDDYKKNNFSELDSGYSQCMYKKIACIVNNATNATTEAPETPEPAPDEILPEEIMTEPTTKFRPQMCYEPPENEYCVNADPSEKYYYHPGTDKCLKFTYYGCHETSEERDYTKPNRFNFEDDCEKTCVHYNYRDCEFSWVPTGQCNCDGLRSMELIIEVEAQNGGRPCPYQTERKEHCDDRPRNCPSQFSSWGGLG